METLNYFNSRLESVVITPNGGAPRFSPILLFGLAVQSLPLAPLQPVLSRIMTMMERHHPDVFKRLSGIAEPRFLIDPDDLPFCFVLDLDAAVPELTVIRDAKEVDVVAWVRGPLQGLIDLLEGRVDGDALFFSRILTFGGDTEAVVALRNALDGSEISLINDFLRDLGPLAGPAEKAVKLLGYLYFSACRDMESVRRSVGAPCERRIDKLSAQVNRLDEKLEDKKRVYRRKKVG